MISGILTVYPMYGRDTYSIKGEVYRHMPCVTTCGVTIHITIKESDYLKYQSLITENQWELKNRFNIWGEVKSVNDITSSLNLTNLFIRSSHMQEAEEGDSFNLFSINAHGTRKIEKKDDYNLYWVAANKTILNNEEKRNKPSYTFLKTNKNVNIQEKDIVQGSVAISKEGDDIILSELHLKVYESCRKLVELFVK